MTPSIYDFADVRAWFCAWLAHHPDSGTRKLRRWVGRQLKLKASALGMVIGGERSFQNEWIDALASMAGLDADGREYLRRLIALQDAGPREAGDVQRSVWEIYAARHGSTARGLRPATQRSTPAG